MRANKNDKNGHCRHGCLCK